MLGTLRFYRGTSREALEGALGARPSREVRKGHRWHLGNVRQIDDDAAYFRVGRTTRTTLEQFDEGSGNFVDQEFDNSPYTHVVLDLDRQVCAIAAKSRLAPNVTGIAKQFQELLSETEVFQLNFLVCSVEPLEDPEDFLEQLRGAYRILRFTFEFTRPNPWDDEADFQRPMEGNVPLAVDVT